MRCAADPHASQVHTSACLPKVIDRRKSTGRAERAQQGEDVTNMRRLCLRHKYALTVSRPARQVLVAAFACVCFCSVCMRLLLGSTSVGGSIGARLRLKWTLTHACAHKPKRLAVIIGLSLCNLRLTLFKTCPATHMPPPLCLLPQALWPRRRVRLSALHHKPTHPQFDRVGNVVLRGAQTAASTLSTYKQLTVAVLFWNLCGAYVREPTWNESRAKCGQKNSEKRNKYARTHSLIALAGRLLAVAE